MYYTIYRISNKLNGKYYIGMHKTKDLDDGYMGSGKLIRRAIVKYGLENFKKEILFIFDNEIDMVKKEAELVFIEEDSYNLCDGGKGGFGYINRTMNIDYKSRSIKGGISYGKKAKLHGMCNIPLESKKKGRTKIKELYPNSGFFGKSHSEEWRENHSKLMKEKQKGSENSQFGTCWITNGTENKKIKKDDLDHWVELGYNKGRNRIIQR